MGAMKELFLRCVVYAVWRRRKGVYYAASVISIAGNLVVFVGPTVQASILSCSRALPDLLTIGYLFQTSALQAASTYIGLLQTGYLQAAPALTALQAHAWSTSLPHVADLVLQRSVLCILLNLIVMRIVVKSGLLAGWMSSPTPPSYMKQVDDLLHPLSNFHTVCVSQSLAPTYLCNTLSNLVDLSTASSVLLQHAQYVHVKGTAAVESTSLQRHPSTCYLHDDMQSKDAPAMLVVTAAPSVLSSPAPVPAPSLFTIEPLDELVQSMKPHETPNLDAQSNSMRRLRKVATKVDLLQAVRAQRRMESGPKAVSMHQEKSGGCVQGGEAGKHGIRRKEQLVQAMKQGKKKYGGGGGWEGERHDDGDDTDNELSRQQFNERVDTFISKFKTKLTMQRKDSLTRLLGLY